MKALSVLSFLSTVAVCAAMAGAATINVGPSRTYTTVQAGVDAASPGDTVQIDAVTLTGNAAAASWTKDNLTIKGSAGTVLDFAGATGGGGLTAALGVTTVTFDTLECVHESHVGDPPTGVAGAAIMSHASGSTLINNCKLHDTGRGFYFYSDGSTSAAATVQNSHIYNASVDGNTYNYCQNIGSLTIKGCWCHGSFNNYYLNCTAARVYILYNRMGTEPGLNNPNQTSGTPEDQMIALPNGGLTYVIGNCFTQAANTQSGRDVINYLEGTLNPGYSSQLYVVYNTIALNRAATTHFLYCPTTTVPAYVADNVCTHDGQGYLVNGNIVNNAAMINSNCVLYTHQGMNPLAVQRFMYDANGYDCGATSGGGHYSTPNTLVTWDVLNYRPVDPNTFPNGAACSNTSAKMPLTGYQTLLNPGAGIMLLVPGSNPLALPATGEDGTSLIPIMQFSNMPQVPGVAGGTEFRLDATSTIGAYGPPSVPPPPHGTITSVMPPFIYEGWTVNMAATATGGTPPYTYQWTQTTGQSQTLTDATILTPSFTVALKSLTSRANETLTFQFVVGDSLNSHSTPVSTSVTCYMCGDVDHDQAVILADLKLLVAAWNTTPASPNWNAWADLDGDHAIILADLKLLVANWNRSL